MLFFLFLKKKQKTNHCWNSVIAAIWPPTKTSCLSLLHCYAIYIPLRNITMITKHRRLLLHGIFYKCSQLLLSSSVAHPHFSKILFHLSSSPMTLLKHFSFKLAMIFLLPKSQHFPCLYSHLLSCQILHPLLLACL